MLESLHREARLLLLCNLSSYAGIKEGDPISAGDVIGFMGDTGYSKREGTTGKFPVHLHLWNLYL